MTTLPQTIAIDFTDEKISSSGGSVFLARAAARLKLPERLREALRLKVRARGASDVDTLLSLIYTLAQGDGTLSDVDALAADEVRQTLLGLSRVPSSRRAGEYLARFDAESVAALQDVARQVAGELADTLCDHARTRHGYVPVFLDGTAIEVTGRYTEAALPGFVDQPHLWWHQVFVGAAQIVQRLHPGTTDAAVGWEALLEETAGQLAGQTDIWLRADNAYYKGKLVSFCRSQGWDYSISVTHRLFKQPVLETVDGLDNDAWEPISDHEDATIVYHRPRGWDHDAVYVVVRTWWDGTQKLTRPRHVVILCSRDDLPLGEIVARHRGKQGQETAQKGPLIDLDLHHPPCRRFHANRAYYTLGQLAQLLLIGVQHYLLPAAARGHRIGTIIRRLIRLAAKLVRSGRVTTLKFAKTALRLDWINHAADVLDSWARDPT